MRQHGFLVSPVRAYEEILKELLSVIEVQDRVEVAVSDVSTISVAESKKVARQLLCVLRGC